MTKKQEDILTRIEAFNRDKGGGFWIQKAARSNSLFRENNCMTIARLRPTGKGDQVEDPMKFFWH